MNKLHIASVQNITEEEYNQLLKYPILTLNTINDNSKQLQIPDNNTSESTLACNANDETSVINNDTNIVYRVLHPEDLQLKLPSDDFTKTTKRGRPKKVYNKQDEIPVEENTSTPVIPCKVFRTRSGRMSKPPRHIHQNLKEIQEKINSDNKEVEIPTSNTIVVSVPGKTSDPVTNSEYKRNISSQYRCTTCKKAYLGRSKMAKHLQLNPGHVAPTFNTISNEVNLWSELLRRTQNAAKDQQARLLCEEFVMLVQKARDVIPKLLKPVNDKDTCFTVDKILANILGIPEGNYSFVEKISTNELINCEYNEENKKSEERNENGEHENCVQNNDQNSLLNLLDTGQVTFDSSASTEEVMNVDQLINERLKTLTGGELEAPNTGSQNLNLDLSLDMFSYHTN